MSIIEMAVVLAAAALLTMKGITEDLAKQRAAMLSGEAANMAVIASALGSYVTSKYADLLALYTASGGNPVLPAPSLDDLFASGNLKQAHRNGPIWGGTYVITLSMTPAGCSAAAGNCHVAYALYPSKPVTKGGKVDVAGAGAVTRAGGNQFGFSRIDSPSVISGLNGAWTANNPLGATAGALLVTNGPSEDGNSLFIRRDGSLTWTGDQNANGVSINNLNNVIATGTAQAGQLAAKNGSGTSTVTNDGAGNTSIMQAGTMQVMKTGGATYAPIHSGDVLAEGILKPANIAVARAACSNNTGIAGATDGSGLLMSCQNGVWLPVGGAILRMAYWNVSHGSVVPAPVCAGGGLPQIELNPQNFSVNSTTVVNFGPAQGTGPWTIPIVDGAGQPIWGARGVVSTYCAY